MYEYHRAAPGQDSEGARTGDYGDHPRVLADSGKATVNISPAVASACRT
jgi:hypothetical protein